STVQAAVQSWGGEIRVASAVGQGSTFTVRLPAWSGTREAGEGSTGPGSRSHPLTTTPLLIVEDDEGIARLMALTLEEQGYATVRVANGLEALERLQERSGAFGLVVLDLLLPELGGEQVYRVLRGLVPELPVLLVSGREDLVRALAPGGPWVAKPFTPDEFLEGVSRALRGGS
ncbi:MAG: response regulator, partial [Proteobacteria bacterium]|nr:response regulator [Pseudomonadota bacterium]